MNTYLFLLCSLVFLSECHAQYLDRRIPDLKNYLGEGSSTPIPQNRRGPKTEVYVPLPIEPAFIVIPIPSKTRISPGESVIIRIFIDGCGMVDKADIDGIIPRQLLASDTLQFIQKVLGTTDDLHVEEFRNTAINPIFNNFTFEITKMLFCRTDTIGLGIWGSVVARSAQDQFSALNISFTTSPSARAGEYRIPFTLKYIWKGRAYVSTTSTSITVLSFGELNRYWLSGLLSVLLALVVAVERSKLSTWWKLLLAIPPILAIVQVVLLLAS